jgi:predicted DNA-binding transcriptional regulator AlpA
MIDVSECGGLDRLITEKATAEILGISPDTLRRLGRRGEGPVRRKISPRRVGYKVSEVEAYRDGKSLEAYRDGKSLAISDHNQGDRGHRRRWR